MHIDSSSKNSKYLRHLLRESYREGGKVKHNTLANISHCSEDEIEAMKLALKHKGNLAELGSLSEDVVLRQGLSVGATYLVSDLASQLGIVKALGFSRQGKLALWQVIARVIDQGSRLSAVRLAQAHAACDILGLEAFNEDDLYCNLDWLCENQTRIEDALFRMSNPDKKTNFFLYDVTSTYLEGACNELAAFGYNRDGKKGKRQLVVGLLCDEKGRPVSIEVFAGNTQDPSTVASQVRKLVSRFGGGEVTFVGDRGMLKSKQIEDLTGHGFHYITAITKPQIEALLARDVFQMSLFDQELAEVETAEGIRYILRRNPLRAKEVAASREDKLKALRKEVQKQNQYIALHPQAKEDAALRKVCQAGIRLRISGWVSLSLVGREIALDVDDAALVEAAKLDGCYVLKTDLQKEVASKEVVHCRYKDLALVEWAFRTSKTVELEMRPVNVRTEEHTRGHALVVMLSYLVVQELAERWRDVELTVSEGINQLSSLCATEMLVKGKPCLNHIPEPRPMLGELLEKARVSLPKVISCRGIRVATRKKLVGRRKTR